MAIKYLNIHCGTQHISYLDMLLRKTSKNELMHEKQSTVLPQLMDQFGNDPRIIERVEILLDQGANIDAEIRGRG